MSSVMDELGKDLSRIREILAGCGAGEVRLIGGGGRGSGGGEVQFLVRMEESRTLADIIPAEDALTELLGRPVFIIPRQTLHPDQAGRLKAESVPL